MEEINAKYQKNNYFICSVSTGNEENSLPLIKGKNYITTETGLNNDYRPFVKKYEPQKKKTERRAKTNLQCVKQLRNM